MNASFGSISSSGYGWETLYGVYRWDAESGPYQVRYRYQQPLLGTWITRDPIGYRGGFNLYAYSANAATNAVDANGLDPKASEGALPLLPIVATPLWPPRPGWVYNPTRDPYSIKFGTSFSFR
jgi:RHS repeat-associated protein